MPLALPPQLPSVLIRRAAFERAGLSRTAVDQRLDLTDEEFRVEGALIVVGPVLDEDGLAAFISDLESAGLVYYEDFFDFSGNWPDWIRVFVGQA